MTTSVLLIELYNNAFSGNIDKTTAITDRLLKKGVSFRLINKVFALSYAKYRIEDIYLTVKSLIMAEGNLSFSMN